MNRARRDENKALESSKSVEGGRNRGKQGLFILREKRQQEVMEGICQFKAEGESNKK